MKCNYHTHTTFCDGKASPEETARAAFEKKFDILGFSGHSMYPFSSDWHIASREHSAYCAEIERLKKLYASKMQIMLGFEADYIPGVCSPDFDCYKEFNPDYLIGSVHFIPCKDGFFEADGNPDQVRQQVATLLKGNTKLAVQKYFALEREMLQKGNFSIIGHADLIRKQNSKSRFFDENELWYKRELKATAKAILKAGACAEINTGGMARGYMNTPYPSPYFLELLHEEGVPIILCSDAHSPDFLDYAFDEAATYAKKAGYTELSYLVPGELKFQKI